LRHEKKKEKLVVIKRFLEANELLSNKSENYFKGFYGIHNFEIIVFCILMEFSFGTFDIHRVPPLRWSAHSVLS